MRFQVRIIVVAVFLAVASLSMSAACAADRAQSVSQGPVAGQKQNAAQEQWRYTFHNGEWWYWLPTSQWAYWRDSRWNSYDPKTYIAPGGAGVAETSHTGSTNASRTDTETDVGPFYGRIVADSDRRPVEANNEIGPFYDSALPGEVFDHWRACRSTRPSYGRAVSSDGN